MGRRMGARRSGGLRQQQRRGEGEAFCSLPPCSPSLLQLQLDVTICCPSYPPPPLTVPCRVPHWVLGGMLPTEHWWLGFPSHDSSPLSGSPFKLQLLPGFRC